MKRVLISCLFAGFVVVLGGGCFSTPDQQLARSNAKTSKYQGSGPVWSWNLVPTNFEGTNILLNPNFRVVKAWRVETNSDNHISQVSYDVIVDAFGRPVMMLKADN